MSKFLTGHRAWLSIVASLLGVVGAVAAIPASYYRSASGKKDAELKTALHQILYNHKEVSSYQDLPNYFRRTDVYPPGNERYGQWWDMYGNIPLYSNTFWGLHREHSFPKSWWGGSDATPAYVDLNHLYPAEAAANMAKSNYPLGVAQPSKLEFDNGVTRVGYPIVGQGGGAAKVFEPDDEYKGDFARTYFYMVTCYQNLTWRYTYMVSNNTYPTLADWAIRMLLQWHRDDPVSQKEIDRNEQIYNIQANRNPFIDYPELADYIWGTRKGQPWFPGSATEPAGDPILDTPVQDMTMEFGQTAVGKTNTASLFFHGENLTGTLTVTVTRPKGQAPDAPDYRQFFTPAESAISASVVCSDGGYWLRVAYTPTEVGTHEARLVISDGGLPGSRGVALKGEALPVPTLHTFRALSPTDITPTSYMANWEVPADDVVDYYIVTRTVINNGTSASQELLAENNELEITDCEPGSRESYHVRSVRLGYESLPSNEVFVDLAGMQSPDITVDNPLGWAFMSGGVRLVCTAPHTGVRVFDAMGRLVRLIPEIDNNTEIPLPLGAYFITTDSQPTPLRVLVKE